MDAFKLKIKIYVVQLVKVFEGHLCGEQHQVQLSKFKRKWIEMGQRLNVLSIMKLDTL